MADNSDIPVTAQDKDLWARTIIGEAGDDPSAAAVAHVIANRMRSGQFGGQSASGVVLAPGQFEPWSTRRGELLGYSSQSEPYKRASGIVDDLLSGKSADPTNGATQFYAPAAQHALGRRPPPWDDGTGTRIGAHVFFGGKPMTDDDLLQMYSRKPAPAGSPTPAATPTVAPQPQANDPADDALLQLYTKKAPVAAAAPAQRPGILSNAPDDSLLAATGKNLATGAVKGLSDIPGMPGNLNSMVGYLLDRAESGITGKPLADVQAANAAKIANFQADRADNLRSVFGAPAGNALSMLPSAQSFPTGAEIAKPTLNALGEYRPDTPFGRAIQSGVETAIGAGGMGPVNALAPRAIGSNALAGGIGQAVTDATGDPLIGMAGAAAPGVMLKGSGNALTSLAGNVDPEVAALGDLARTKYGIPVNAAQMSESPAVRFGNSALSRLPFSGAGTDTAMQQSAFTRAVSKALGENTDRITPTVMQAAKSRLGSEFDAVANGTTIQADPQFIGDLRGTLHDARTVLPEAELKPLYSQVRNVLDTLDQNTRTISGSSYQALTRKGTPLDRAMQSADPNVAHYAGQIRDALDDAMQRSAPPDLADRLSTARGQYKAMKTIEDLVEKSPDGHVSPALLMGAVRKSYGNMAYNGGGALGDLARIGQRFLKEPPSSGTAERLSALGWAGALGSSAVGLNELGVLPPGILPHMTPQAMATSALSIPASLGIARGMGSALRSNWLANSVLNRSLGRPQQGVASNALMAGALPYFARSGNALAVPPGSQ